MVLARAVTSNPEIQVNGQKYLNAATLSHVIISEIMNVLPTSIPDVLILEPRLFQDDRGFFLESYNEKALSEKAGIHEQFVQDNHSCSGQHVLRGLHYQIQQLQGKLVRVIVGTILDLAIDLRKRSFIFGQWVSCLLSTENKCQFWVPKGLAHGFLVLLDRAEVLYKTTDYYAPQHERCILWNDPDLAIEWSLTTDPVLSAKDQAGQPFKTAELFYKTHSIEGHYMDKLGEISKK